MIAIIIISKIVGLCGAIILVARLKNGGWDFFFCVGASFVTHQVIPLTGQLVAQITWCSSGVGTKKQLVPGIST